MTSDSDSYDITANMERWTDDDLIKYANDSEFMMSLQKYQIVNIAQELAYRYEDVADPGLVHEYNT